MVVGTNAAVGLFLVDAPEALFQTGVHHFPRICCCHPVCSTNLHGCRSCTNSLPVIETYRLQTLIVSVSSRMVNVEPGCPLCHTWGQTQGKYVRRISTGKGTLISPLLLSLKYNICSMFCQCGVHFYKSDTEGNFTISLLSSNIRNYMFVHN